MKTTTPRTQFATHESKELQRIRSSFSFRFAVLLNHAFRNPLKLIVLPFTVTRELIFRKPKPTVSPTLNSNSIVLVGIDTRGIMWSGRAMKLAIELQRFDSDLRISLLTTSNKILKDRVGKLLHYRIPRPRSVDSGRRDWNLTCERLLSTIIHLQEASRVVFLGDYLYSGIRHSLNSSPSEIHLHWMNSGDNQIGLDKIHVNNSTSVYEDSLVSAGDQSVLSESTMQDHLNLRLDQTTLAHLQLTSSGLNLWENVLEESLRHTGESHFILTASHKKYGFLSETIDIPRHIEPFSTPGFHFRIIDDQPELIAKVNQDRIPSLILRTERLLDKVSLKILEELERCGAVIVLRKPNRFTIIDALETFMDMESRKRMITNRAKTSSEVSHEVTWSASMHSLIIGD
jgi:hypothetical protein